MELWVQITWRDQEGFENQEGGLGTCRPPTISPVMLLFGFHSREKGVKQFS